MFARLLLSCFVVAGTTATAAELTLCRGIYNSDSSPTKPKGPPPGKGPVAPVDNWQNVLSRPASLLHPDLRKELNAHPVVKRLKSKYGDGKNLRFGYHLLDYRKSVQFKVKLGGGLDIQGNFLGGVVDSIFPKAWPLGFSGATKALNLLPKDIDFTLHDWTSSLKFKEAEIDSFEMGLLKAANPGPELPRKSTLRQLFNLPQQAKIVSFYEAYYLSDISSLQYIKSIFDAKLADIAILSTADRFWEVERQLNADPALASLRLVHSDLWPKIKPEPGVRYVIWNGTFGQMNAIHKAADYAVVLGAGNIYEPLQVGRRTYFEKAPEAIVERGTETAWKVYADRAVQTGGGFAYSTIADLISQIQNTAGVKPSKKVSETTNAEGLKPIDQILLQLEQLILGRN